jgi:tRNA pseudouridine32 synthase
MYVFSYRLIRACANYDMTQRQAIEAGSVLVSGKVATIDTVVPNGAIVSHSTHRHEPPVTGLPIGIVHEDDDMLVIDKPAGIPVHGAGRYYHNSIIQILKSEHPGLKPHPCNRLDRLTSGVMFVAKNPQGAERFTTQLKERSVQKEYVARVSGRFPDGVVVCDQPIMSVSPKLGLNRVRATGKEAMTKFRRLAYYPPQKKAKSAAAAELTLKEEQGYSIVHCLPLTGRTHQIRVHLQFVGYPISNDPIYSNRRVFGPSLGKHDSSADHDEQIIDLLSNMGKTELADTSTYRTHLTCAPDVPPETDPSVVEAIMYREHSAAVDAYHKRKGERLSGETCETCETPLYTDPGAHELGIFLHAARYSAKNGEWKYRSALPTWAFPPEEGMQGPTAIPEWLDAAEGEEMVVNTGYKPREDGNDGEGKDDDVLALVRGVGMVNLSQKLRDGQDIDSSLA